MITEYSKEIFKMAENKENKVFFNSSAEHATIVHQALVKYATSYLDIFSSCMCTEISNNSEYCQLMERFLMEDEKRRVNIVLTDYTDNFRKTPIAKVLSKFPLQVTVKHYNGCAMYKGKPAHFTIADDRSFRLETDITKHIAFGNFSSPDKTLALKTVFEKVFDSDLSKSVSLEL